MKISYVKYSLSLKHQFTISYSSRSTTPAVIVKIEQDGFTGFGEAALPPYLPETQDTVVDFLRKAASIKNFDVHKYNEFLTAVDKIEENNTAAKAAIDIAVHDLAGRVKNLPCYKLLGIEKRILPFTSFTIGIDSPEILKQKIKEADQFKILKIKLGTGNDRQIIDLIREETDKPLFVDINQGWNNREEALENTLWFKEQNVMLVEQPFPKNNLHDSEWLSARSPIPIIADESVQRFTDIERIKHAFTGINIKLMKCTGINEAYKMIEQAKQFGLKIMLGCMTETSCAISAALQLASLTDYADLDGNQLISNDPFEADTIKDGMLILPEKPGLGLQLLADLTFNEVS